MLLCARFGVVVYKGAPAPVRQPVNRVSDDDGDGDDCVFYSSGS